MSATAPVAVESHNGDGEPRTVTHRTKHRKEVKRYHQRQQNKKLREEAKGRDAKLFLFDRNPAAEGAAAAETIAVPAVNSVAEDGGGGDSHTSSSTKQKKTITGKKSAAQGKEAAAGKSSAAASTATAAQLEKVDALPPVNQIAAPLKPFSQGSWDFDFVLRKAPPSSSTTTTTSATAAAAAEEESTVADVQTAAVVSAASPSPSPAQTAMVRVTPHATPLPPLAPPATTSLVAATRYKQPNFAHAERPSEPRNGPSGNSTPISVLPIDNAVGTSINKLLSNTHVQRVDGVPAIPMEAPLLTGTDLNKPPRNYLTLDPVYNVHQHAPGFLRDQRVALQHMLAAAMANWKDVQQSALIVTSAEAMRSIFEQVYVPSRPLALRVRKIGPAILIDTRTTQPSQVNERRQQALFSKALYLMKESHGRDMAADEAAAADQMTVALPARRLSSLAASDAHHYGANLHRYSQLLRWRIDSTEVLVGNDAPVVVDLRTGTEQLVRVRAADSAESNDSEQQDALRCWFEAMMANVPYVGTYVEFNGTVLSYQVKKTNDLLNYVETRMAGAALGFTSTTLQWLVKHCQRDGGTYAMFRDFAANDLKLYELPEMDDSNAFVAETDKYFSATPPPSTPPAPPSSPAGDARERGGSSTANGGGGGRGHFGGAGAGSDEDPYAGYPSSAPHLNRFSLNLGRTCFHIGQYLYREGGVARANDALTLLHRSLRVFLPCCTTEVVARETMVEMVQMLPVLVSRKMQADATTTSAAAAAAASSCTPGNTCSVTNCCGAIGGPTTAGSTPAGFVTAACSSPELYREALLLCGRFEIPLRRAFTEAGRADGDPLMQAFFARCLVASSAAVCTVVAASLEAYYCGCHHLRVMRRARCEAKSKDVNKTTALRSVDHREDVMAALASMIQDLLQVVVEGLVRLEETSALISPLHAAETATATTSTTTTATTTSGTAGQWTVPASVLVTAPAAQPSTKSGASGAGVSTKEELSSAGHSSSSAASSTASAASTASSTAAERTKKRTSSPARVAVAAAQSGELVVDGATKMAAPCGTVLDPRTQVDTTPLRSALCELYGDVVMIAMADSASGFTTRALAELGSRLEARAAATEQQLPTTLEWLTSLRPDVVSLSFTALRFYGRVATHTRRHLNKLAQVYYLVGKEHYRTARYTKALEALHRSKSLLQASHKAAEDVSFGDAFGTHGMMQWGDVMRLLGDVYRRVVERKLETAHGTVHHSITQPLLAGPLHNLPEDADTFFSQALQIYTQGGSDESCKSAKSCTLLIYASVRVERIALSGEPASRATSQRIFELLRESEALTPNKYLREREWQTLRLFTVTSPSAADAALVRAVEEIMLRFTAAPLHPPRPSDVDDAEREREPMWVDADVADCGGRRQEYLVVPPQCSMIEEMQKALVSCVMVERLSPTRITDLATTKTATAATSSNSTNTTAAAGSAAVVAGSEGKYRSLLRWVGRAATYLMSVTKIFLDGKDLWSSAAVRHQWLSTLRTWGYQTLGGCLHHMVCMIGMRLFVAAQGQLPSTKQQEAREAFRQIGQFVEEAPNAMADSEEAHESIVASLDAILEVLRPFSDW